jgi:hypothetical protein
MNKFHSWELGSSEKEKCGKCGMTSKKNSSCCHDEVKLIKLQQDTLTAKSTIFSFAMPELVLVTTAYILHPFTSYQSVNSLSLKGPPILSDQEVYIRNCVFRL